MPEDLVDDNVRIDYGKLRHLMVVSQRGAARPNGNFDLLRELLGEGRAAALAIEGERRGTVRLAIPNHTIRQLLYGYLREAYRDVELFSVNQHRLTILLSRMAFDGEWRPVVELLRDAIAEQTGIRDYIAGEKVLQGFLAAYFGLSASLIVRSEVEPACVHGLILTHLT